ncbi:hypothetical protein Ddye_014044 [Dipteronia dyeriana]|uniref:RNase H type-1 domain-containing protein n=1 Tax=Dipteronia dyeriana TaxID=168575 RepID=A0AAD9X831_9ROSI|nr:hypothetical protein Ddye_014044 [Dipteronia dyeriana]
MIVKAWRKSFLWKKFGWLFRVVMAIRLLVRMGYWEAIQGDFMNFINEFHTDSTVVRVLNRSFIALIPKVGNPMTLKDFRPISLVSLMYKVLAKVLANRLRKDGSITAGIVNGSLSAVIGYGDKVKVWSDVKVEGSQLRDVFLRCYALAVLKEGIISDFSYWEGFNCVWNIRTRRLLFGWEKDQWHLFSTFLECIFVRNHIRDTIAWSMNSNGLFTNVVKASEVVKFWVVWWFKHMGKGSMDAIQTMLLNVKEFCVDSMISKKKIIFDWNPPAEDQFKFNVDGSVLGKPRPTGAGGVLREFNGKILCLFSYHLGILDSNAAEIWAIKVALGL